MRALQRCGACIVGLAFASLSIATLSAGVNDIASRSQAQQVSRHDGQRDFDFCFGRWKAQLRVLRHPLTGSHDWVNYSGISAVQKIWNGRANMAELEVNGPSSHIEALSLRLYDPQSGEWRVYFANSKSGELGVPMIGGFAKGRGEFYDQEQFSGRAIFVRFIFSDIERDSFHFEQAFSADGGETWEPNWIGTFTREK
jgi:hypothetical protein